MMPDDALGMIGLLVEKGRRDLARQMLTHWATRPNETAGAELHAFVQAAALVGDPVAPLGKLVQLARSGSDAAAEGQLAEEFVNAFGRPALAAIKPLLTNEVLLGRPLFAAELSEFDGNREMARWYLNRVDPAELPPQRLTAWMGLAHRVEMDAEVFRQLALLSNDKRLSPDVAPLLANEAEKLGQGATHDLIWNSIRR